MSKLHAYVIRDATHDTPKWSIVAQSEYTEDGTWVSGMVLITSIEDVLDRAEKKVYQLYLKVCLRINNAK